MVSESWIKFIEQREDIRNRLRPKRILFKGLRVYLCSPNRTTLYNQKPNRSGVYFIVVRKGNGKRKIVYIGSCMSFATRMSGHPKLKFLSKTLPADKRVEILFYETDKKEYQSKEREFLRLHKPPLNINGKKVRNLAS